MNRQPVESSNIESVGWENETLEVEFKNKKSVNSVYQYKPVSENTYKNVIGSFQPGVEVRKIINDKGIVCTKM